MKRKILILSIFKEIGIESSNKKGMVCMYVYNQQRRRLENLHLPVKVVCQDSFKKLTSRAVIIICSNEMKHEPICPKR